MPRKVPTLAIWIDASTAFTSDELNAMLEEWCKELTPRQREVMVARYGILGGARRTVTEIRKLYNIPESRVRSIHANALKKLRLIAAKSARGPFLFSDA